MKSEYEEIVSKGIYLQLDCPDLALARHMTFKDLSEQEFLKRAEGDAKRFLQQYEEYKKAPDITRKRIYLETMEEILPNINKVIMENKKGSNVLPILPLGKNSILGGNK